MNRGVWVAAVALGLGGLFSSAVAQDAWRAVQRPQAPPPSPGAVICKPVPIVRGSSGVLEPSPRMFPPAYRESSQTPIGTTQAIAVVSPPGTVIAASGPGARAPGSGLPGTSSRTPSDDSDTSAGDLFAADRPLPPPQRTVWSSQDTPTVKPARQIVQVGNWSEPFPANGPLDGPPAHLPETAPMEMGDEMVGMAGPRFYLRAEYLLWWIKNDSAPALVTTGDPNSQATPLNPGALAGALGAADTQVLFGGRLTENPYSGARFTAGYFLDDCGAKAIEFTGFFLAPRSRDFSASSAQFPVISRPFFALNPELNLEAVQRVAFPGSQSGTIRIHAPTQLWGLESNLLCKCCCGCDYRIDVLAGPRYLNLREGLNIAEDIQFGANSPFPGAHGTVFDSFVTKNQFYGGQIGVAGRWYRGPFSVDGIVKVAAGITHEEVDINGNATLFNPNGTVTHAIGGLLALNSNIGNRSRDRFSIVPEVGLRLGYAVTERVRLLVGYNFLYWSNVVRPGEQIDRGLDVNRIPFFPVNFNPVTGAPITTLTPISTPRPAPLFNTTDIWAQGLTFGVELTF
jgi:hypothetical protein